MGRIRAVNRFINAGIVVQGCGRLPQDQYLECTESSKSPFRMKAGFFKYTLLSKALIDLFGAQVTSIDEIRV